MHGRPAVSTLVSKPLTALRLSIVVLLFANLSYDADQQYFPDGVTDNVTTDLGPTRVLW
jgi:TolB-like protein